MKGKDMQKKEVAYGREGRNGEVIGEICRRALENLGSDIV